VLHRGRIGEHAGEARAVEHVAPVQDLPERGEDVASVPEPGSDAQCDLQRHHGGDRQEDGREDAAGAALPESSDGELPVLRPLGEGDGRDEEARQREEAGQAEEPTPRELEALVERQHRQQRDGPQAVERSDAGQLGSGPGCGPEGAAALGRAVVEVTRVGPGVGVGVGVRVGIGRRVVGVGRGVVVAWLVVGPRRLDGRRGCGGCGRGRNGRPQRAVTVAARPGLAPGCGGAAR
jgi:hypothetical protein